MIQPVGNSVSFKALYADDNATFSDSQTRVVNDIKLKLGDNLKQEDYFLKAGYAKDSVTLFRFIGLKKLGVGIDKSHTYKDKICIGTYDENHPFKTEDDVISQKEYTKKQLGTIAIMLLAIVGIVGAGLSSKKNSSKVTEKTIQLKNSLASDSTKILKDAFKKP